MTLKQLSQYSGLVQSEQQSWIQGHRWFMSLLWGHGFWFFLHLPKLIDIDLDMWLYDPLSILQHV